MGRHCVSASGLWILALVLVVRSQDVPVPRDDVFGIFGKSTKLKCPLESSSEIQWYDWVYSLDGITPATLYKDGKVTEDEYRTGRLTVNTKTQELTISELMEDDAGRYYCQTEAGEKHEFQLALGKMPECSGHVLNLRPGEQTNLECTMEYSGTAPVMEWLREGELLETNDKTEIGKALENALIDVVPEMDGQTFTCRVVSGDMVEECQLTFEVKYGVQDLKISPEKAAYSPGSEFVCSAKGNPAPNVVVTLPDGEKKTGVNEVKVVIPDEWVGMSKSITCDADNIEDGMTKTETYEFSFDVAKEVEPVEPENPAGSTGEGGDGDAADGSSTQMAGIVAGVVIGAVVLVIIIIAVVCVKKRQSKPPKGSKPVPTKEDGKSDNIA